MVIGVIMLDTRFPRVLGDIGNPETFDVPVLYEIVPGASPQRVVIDQDPALLEPYIDAGRELINRGAKIITTSCGFLAGFQNEIQAALSVPVYTSSLHLVPQLEQKLGRGHVGILTIDTESLNRSLLGQLGISTETPVASPQRGGAFATAILGNLPKLDQSASEKENVDAAIRLVEQHPQVEAIVLECTNMPPYEEAISKATGKPVHSMVSFLKTLHSG